MRFSLKQFHGAFDIKDSAGTPYVIIGGQAVNYWAETFLDSEPALAQFLPFVSKDIDFIGTRADVLKVAKALGLATRLPHKRMRTAFAGAVLFKIGNEYANVEFVRTMPGVRETELTRWAVVSERDGKTIRVADPVSMLICKLNLALTVDQAGRRDADHARILVICVRAFLRETLRGVEVGDLPARGWLGAVERVLKLAESTLGRRAARVLGIEWRQSLPETEIDVSQNAQVVQLRSRRFPLWLAKIGRA